MSKRKRDKSARQHDTSPRVPVPVESRAAEAATVAWMMTVMTTLLCGGISLVVGLAAQTRPGAELPRMFSGLLHFGAMITALLSLGLLAAVLKLRKTAPPRAITAFAVALAVLVLLAALTR